MRNDRQAFPEKRALIWAAAAVLSGCTLMIVMGAPARMPLMNGAAFLIGLATLGVIHASKRLGAASRHADWAIFCVALSIPATALVGPEMDGVSRWLVVGGITVQPALIVAPVLALAFSARQSTVLLLSVAAASSGLAMQPDPGAAAMLLLGLAAPLAIRGKRSAAGGLAVAFAAAALAIAAARAVDLPPVPFVEQMLVKAAEQGPLPGLLAMLTIVFLFLPARSGSRPAAYAFAGIWTGALAASLSGAYPTPVLGFGGSAVLGYVLSVGLLVALGQMEPISAKGREARDAEEDGAHLRCA